MVDGQIQPHGGGRSEPEPRVKGPQIFRISQCEHVNVISIEADNSCLLSYTRQKNTWKSKKLSTFQSLSRSVTSSNDNSFCLTANACHLFHY